MPKMYRLGQISLLLTMVVGRASKAWKNSQDFQKKEKPTDWHSECPFSTFFFFFSWLLLIILLKFSLLLWKGSASTTELSDGKHSIIKSIQSIPLISWREPGTTVYEYLQRKRIFLAGKGQVFVLPRKHEQSSSWLTVKAVSREMYAKFLHRLISMGKYV